MYLFMIIDYDNNSTVSDDDDDYQLSIDDNDD